mmetsp:Transcript_11109/g.26360  ORF Transcript_11109/g.26360 Transcript_11109/m.26360 type:complete len:270 (+) Transcript_11109:519-1328(+)
MDGSLYGRVTGKTPCASAEIPEKATPRPTNTDADTPEASGATRLDNCSESNPRATEYAMPVERPAEAMHHGQTSPPSFAANTYTSTAEVEISAEAPATKPSSSCFSAKASSEVAPDIPSMASPKTIPYVNMPYSGRGSPATVAYGLSRTLPQPPPVKHTGVSPLNLSQVRYAVSKSPAPLNNDTIPKGISDADLTVAGCSTKFSVCESGKCVGVASVSPPAFGSLGWASSSPSRLRSSPTAFGTKVRLLEKCCGTRLASCGRLKEPPRR